MNPIQRAVQICGGQTGLAKAIGGSVKQAHVWKWLRSGRVSAERALEIERATNGAVSKYDLRPDIFGPTPAKPRKAVA